MTTYAYITSIEAGSGGEIINKPSYFSNPRAALNHITDVCDYSNIKASADDLSLSAMMDRYWHQSSILKAIGKCRFNVMGWTAETKLVWIIIERVALKN